MWGLIKDLFCGCAVEDEQDNNACFNEMVSRIKKHEGLMLKPYRCPAGKLSIGYGRNLEDCGISQEEADYLLLNDIEKAEKELKNNFKWVESIDFERYYALVELVFNMGIARFKGFKKMLGACEKGEWSKASDELLDSLYAKQVGKRAKTLANILKG